MLHLLRRVRGSVHSHSLKYCTLFVIATLLSWNNHSGADADIFGPQNAFFGFYVALEWHSSAF